MTDKITGPGGPFPATGPQGRVNGENRGAGTAASGGSSSAPAGDAVSLTGDAEMLRALDAKIAETPTVDRALVERVRDALANGEYQVNGDRIAEKLLSAESSLGPLLFRN